MKKFKLVFEDIISPGRAIPAGTPNQGQGKGSPSSSGAGQPGKGGQPVPGEPIEADKGEPVKGKPGKGKPGKGEPQGGPPVNDMLPDGTSITPLDGSEVINTTESNKSELDEIKRRAHDHHTKQVEAASGLSKTSTRIGMDIPSADFQTILQDMFGSFSAKSAYTWSRGNRRNPVLGAMGSGRRPGKVAGKPDYGNILIGIDTSGSITESMLSQYVGAVLRIAEEHAESIAIIRIVLYSGPAHHYIDFNPEEGNKEARQVADDVRSAVEAGYSGGNNWDETMNDIFITGFRDEIRGINVNFNDMTPPIEEFNGFVFLTDGIEGGFEKSFLPDGPTVFLVPTLGHSDLSSSLPFFKWVKSTDPEAEIYTINLDKKK